MYARCVLNFDDDEGSSVILDGIKTIDAAWGRNSFSVEQLCNVDLKFVLVVEKVVRC